MKEELTVVNKDVGQRLDIFCASRIPNISRSIIQKAIKEGGITVNEKIVKPRYAIKENDLVAINISDDVTAAPTLEVSAEDLKIPIIFEDDHTLVINKPAGITVHPGVAKEKTTIASWFADRYPDSASVGEDPIRPGIVHRLDKDTSGIMVLAKTQEAFEHLKDQFKRRNVSKEYLALVFGAPSTEGGRITRPLGRSRSNPLRRIVDPSGRPAISSWELEKDFDKTYTLMRVKPHTGRTHQIRVHMHHIGHPIVGDTLYTFKRQNSPKGVKRQMLHAEKISFRLLSNKDKTFTAPLSKDFQDVIDSLSREH